MHARFACALSAVFRPSAWPGQRITKRSARSLAAPARASLFCALGLVPGGAAAAESTLIFQVGGVRTDDGSVRVDICTPGTFLKVDCPYFGSAPAVIGLTTIVVENVPTGRYAAQIYHDRNDNHRVDFGPLKIPKEDIGFSGDPPLGLHGPSFKSAAFDHFNAEDVVTVKLHHFGLRPGPARETPPAE